MHIAICDDNVADRKQMERLLSRESDKRKNETGVFYINSFGNSEILSKSPMQYNLFFIDMAMDGHNGYQFALELIKIGVTAPIALCISAIDYRALYHQSENPPENITFIDKPIKNAHLSKLLDAAIALQRNIPSTIELRTDRETYYIPENDIVCGCVNGRFVDITLTDGRMIQIIDTIFNFYDQIAIYPQFFLVSQKAFINTGYIAKVTFLRVTLQNRITFFVMPGLWFSIKNHLKLQ